MPEPTGGNAPARTSTFVIEYETPEAMLAFELALNTLLAKHPMAHQRVIQSHGPNVPLSESLRALARREEER